MTEPSERNRTRHPTAVLLVTSGIGLLLILLSFVIRVRIVVEQPAVGDVTPLVRVVWRAMLGIATLGSFALGVYDVVAGFELRGLSSTRVEVSGDDNDVDLHLHSRGAIERSVPIAMREESPDDDTLPRYSTEPGDNGTGDDESLEEL